VGGYLSLSALTHSVLYPLFRDFLFHRIFFFKPETPLLSMADKVAENDVARTNLHRLDDAVRARSSSGNSETTETSNEHPNDTVRRAVSDGLREAKSLPEISASTKKVKAKKFVSWQGETSRAPTTRPAATLNTVSGLPILSPSPVCGSETQSSPSPELAENSNAPVDATTTRACVGTTPAPSSASAALAVPVRSKETAIESLHEQDEKEKEAMRKSELIASFVSGVLAGIPSLLLTSEQRTSLGLYALAR
jgi:hypothetical protein